MFLASFYKNFMLFCHFRRYFLANGFAEFIHRFPVVSAQSHCRKKKAALLNQKAEGFFKKLCDFGMKVSYFPFAVLARYVFWNVVHRPRPVKRNHSVNVVYG